MRLQDVGNATHYYTTGMNSPSAAWATSAAANFSRALRGLDHPWALRSLSTDFNQL